MVVKGLWVSGLTNGQGVSVGHSDNTCMAASLRGMASLRLFLLTEFSMYSCKFASKLDPLVVFNIDPRDKL